MERPTSTPATALALALALALPWLPGCGDGLLGEDGLGDLVGLDDLNLPVRPAWRIRWMLHEDYVDGPEHEVAAEAMFLDYAEDDDTWYHYVNYLEVEMPDLQAPPPEAVRDYGAWTLAVGVPMLLDDADGDGAWDAPDDAPEELWGVTPESAFLSFTGDLGLLEQYMPVMPWGGPWEGEYEGSVHEGLQNVWVDPGPLSDWRWRDEWNDFEEWEQECLDLEAELEACWDDHGPDAPECVELQVAVDECWGGLGEFPLQYVLFPDHPDVGTTFHPGAFRVETAQSLDGAFDGGVRAFFSEAWWAWFPDPETR